MHTRSDNAKAAVNHFHTDINKAVYRKLSDRTNLIKKGP